MDKSEYENFISNLDDLLRTVKKSIVFTGTDNEFLSDSQAMQKFIDLYFDTYHNKNGDELSKIRLNLYALMGQAVIFWVGGKWKLCTLKKDEAFIIINDHDPLPLFYQFKAERPEQFEWKYIEEGPATWRVSITKTKDAGKTVADILLENPKAAGVFKKFHIDYCCKGKTPFEEACAEAGLDPGELQDQIDKAGENPAFNMRAQDWGLDFLADYIVNTHHSYVKKTLPDLRAYSSKVAKVHGEQHPNFTQSMKQSMLLLRSCCSIW